MPSTSPTRDVAAADSFGQLFVVATPIGNLEDITLRALKVLATADLIAAEDTRHSGALLSHHRIATRLISYHEHNEAERTPELIRRLEAGQSIALVTDAGTPLISDPGYRLVTAAIDRRIEVIPVPGPTAAITALSVSGLPSDAFVFNGFLTKKKNARRAMLQDLAAERRTLIFYESPKRVEGLLRDLLNIMGNRRCLLSREITKRHEEFIRGPLDDVLGRIAARTSLKGECTLVVAGCDPRQANAPREAVRAEIAAALREKDTRMSELARLLARKYRMPKSEVYDMAVELKNSRGDSG